MKKTSIHSLDYYLLDSKGQLLQLLIAFAYFSLYDNYYSNSLISNERILHSSLQLQLRHVNVLTDDGLVKQFKRIAVFC